MPECNGLVLTMLRITDTNDMTFFVIDQRQITGTWKGTLHEFNGCPDIDKRCIVEEKLAVIVDEW